MKAIRIHTFGGPEVVTYEEVPKPVPREHEVLFKVTSTCANYADVQWRLGNYVDRTLPATLGREAAGIIAAVGPGVTTLQVGQPVMARAIGGNAEYAVAHVQNVFPCPTGLDMQQAGGIPIIFLTAYHLLRSLKSLQPGDADLLLRIGPAPDLIRLEDVHRLADRREHQHTRPGWYDGTGAEDAQP